MPKPEDVVRHPLREVGIARTALRSGSLDDLATAIEQLAEPGSAAHEAVAALRQTPADMSEEAQVGRAADALTRIYEDRERILTQARRMEVESIRSDFAKKVREEIERRFQLPTQD